MASWSSRGTPWVTTLSRKPRPRGRRPIYLQVTRTGTTFTAATSTDGVNWTPIAGSSASLPGLAGAVLAGLAVTSHNTGQLGTAVFGSVHVGP